MGKSQREKGQRGERAAREFWLQFFPDDEVSRNRQSHKGSSDGADLHVGRGGVGWKVEVKVGKKGTIPSLPYSAMAQAYEDPKDALPVVMMKQDRRPWLFVLDEATFRILLEPFHSDGNHG